MQQQPELILINAIRSNTNNWTRTLSKIWNCIRVAVHYSGLLCSPLHLCGTFNCYLSRVIWTKGTPAITSYQHSWKYLINVSSCSRELFEKTNMITNVIKSQEKHSYMIIAPRTKNVYPKFQIHWLPYDLSYRCMNRCNILYTKQPTFDNTSCSNRNEKFTNIS